MRSSRPTRLVACLLLGLAALAAPSAAQMTFPQAYQARVGLGDIPTTTWMTEPSGWNVVQQLRVRHESGNDTMATLWNVTGFAVVEPSCTCGGFESTHVGAEHRFTIPAATPSGDYEVRLASNRASGAVEIAIPVPAASADDAIVIVFVLPDNYRLDAPRIPDEQVSCTQGGCAIATFRGTSQAPLATPFAFGFDPVPAGTAAPGDAGEPMSPWVYAAVAFVLGCIVWALLVRSGVVQKKTRKQSVAVSAHEEIAAEPVPVLEGKKRALLAALKEIEVAKMNAEMDAATYDVVKADFKRQAVTVMRALESGEAKKE